MGIVNPQDASARDGELLVRMSLYLQCTGLPEAHARAKASALLAEYATAARPGGGEPDAYGALDFLALRYGEWLLELCRHAGVGACPEILACRLRPVLHEHPDSFLESARLPEAVHEAVRQSTRRAVPEEQRLIMPIQTIGRPPRLLQAAWWRQLLLAPRSVPWHRGHGRMQKGRQQP